ncbi:MAG: hypothetical protein ACRD1G_10960, partial [Acidimicrobiales bacterium]
MTSPPRGIPDFKIPPLRVVTTSGLYWLLAGLSVGSAAIHFGYTSAHFAEYWLYGLFFAVMAWGQLVWAGALILRPSRLLLTAGTLNALIILVWALSRTVGVGIGPGSSAAEPVGLPDILCTVLEAGIVVGCLGALWRPAASLWPRSHRWFAVGVVGTVTTLLVVGATFSLTPRFAAEHDHSGAGGGHVHTGALAGLHTNHDEAAELQPDKPLDPTTRAQLADQLVAARSVAEKYPTVTDAVAAGMIPAGGFAPGSGAHY